jgi:hypothetical protein
MKIITQTIKFVLTTGIMVLWIISVSFIEDLCNLSDPVFINPQPIEMMLRVMPTPTTMPTPTPPVKWVGMASYYSETGCLGCSPTLTMANGDRLDDDAVTVAFNRAKLNTQVTVTNNKTGQSVRAKVTDRGGFERHGKIIDLNVGTKNAIGCGDVCNVTVAL